MKWPQACGLPPVVSEVWALMARPMLLEPARTISLGAWEAVDAFGLTAHECGCFVTRATFVHAGLSRPCRARACFPVRPRAPNFSPIVFWFFSARAAVVHLRWMFWKAVDVPDGGIFPEICKMSTNHASRVDVWQGVPIDSLEGYIEPGRTNSRSE